MQATTVTIVRAEHDWGSSFYQTASLVLRDIVALYMYALFNYNADSPQTDWREILLGISVILSKSYLRSRCDSKDGIVTEHGGTMQFYNGIMIPAVFVALPFLTNEEQCLRTHLTGSDCTQNSQEGKQFLQMMWFLRDCQLSLQTGLVPHLRGPWQMPCGGSSPMSIWSSPTLIQTIGPPTMVLSPLIGRSSPGFPAGIFPIPTWRCSAWNLKVNSQQTFCRWAPNSASERQPNAGELLVTGQWRLQRLQWWHFSQNHCSWKWGTWISFPQCLALQSVWSGSRGPCIVDGWKQPISSGIKQEECQQEKGSGTQVRSSGDGCFLPEGAGHTRPEGRSSQSCHAFLPPVKTEVGLNCCSYLKDRGEHMNKHLQEGWQQDPSEGLYQGPLKLGANQRCLHKIMQSGMHEHFCLLLL